MPYSFDFKFVFIRVLKTLRGAGTSFAVNIKGFLCASATLRQVLSFDFIDSYVLLASLRYISIGGRPLLLRSVTSKPLKSR